MSNLREQNKFHQFCIQKECQNLETEWSRIYCPSVCYWTAKQYIQWLRENNIKLVSVLESDIADAD
jgi:hypothetical protein